jgi:2-keto-3-deoxy-L-rhamnonate aldolase RhmA
MGLDTFADLTDPALLETLDTIVETASRHGITPGIHAPSPPRAAEMTARGFRFISCAVDADLLREAALTALRATRDPRSAG